MTTDYIETQIDNIAKLEDNWNDNVSTKTESVYK